MMNLLKSSLTMLVATVLFVSCEEEGIPSEILPLVGSYTLTEMTISVEANTLRDTVVNFIVAQNGHNSVQLSAGSLVLETSIFYSDQDSVPISGKVTLENDGSARLSGYLPVNWGTGCLPVVYISELGSDGTWIADTTLGTFEIDLVIDALDINGTYSLIGDQLELRYSVIEELDERMINSVSYEGNDTPIIPGCFPVQTITERVMILTLN